MAREMLNEVHLDEVVGGAFRFYTDSDGNSKCKVDNYGVYDCGSNGFFQYIELKNANPGASGAELLDLCIQEGILW